MKTLRDFLLQDSNEDLDTLIEEARDLIQNNVEAKYASIALQEFGMLPSEFIRLPAYRKAFIIAAIDIMIENGGKK